MTKTKPKQITLFIRNLGGGGAEGVCVNLANELVKKGWDVTLVVMTLKHAVYRDRLSENIHLINLNTSNARYLLIPLIAYLKHNTPQKLLVFNHDLAVILVLIRILLNKNFVIIARNINTLSQTLSDSRGLWKRYIVNNIIRLLYSRIDHVVNQCIGMQNDLLTIFPKLIERTSVIYNPVNSAIENHAKTIDKLKLQHKNYFLCVGRLDHQKAFHYAIRAFRDVLKELPEYQLIIIGEGKLKAELKQLVEDLGISKKVFFKGFQSEMAQYYINCSATVLTSTYEGFPNVLIESITLGAPVIAFDCPSGPNEIITADNGILVPQGNHEKLVNAMLEVAKKPPETKAVLESSKRYSIEKILPQYEELIARNYLQTQK